MSEQYTISQLQKMLEERQNKLQELAQQRQEKLTELKEIDEEIMKLSGETVNEYTQHIDLPIPKKNTTSKKSGGRKTSIDYAKEILTEHPEGLELDELADAVLKAGYPTNSKNFSNALYQSLYKNYEISRNDQGKYAIKDQ